jgi:preprotein translocase subunit YajC
MWALLIRPQQRRVRQHQAVVESLRPGDEVVTAGGLYGRVLSVDDDSMMLEIAPGTEVRVVRAAVSQRVNPDTDDDDESGVDAGEDEEDRLGAEPELAEPTREEE